MRINEECIDHNVARLTKELLDSLYECLDGDEEMDRLRVATLGEIRGICTFAEVMKEVLQA